MSIHVYYVLNVDFPSIFGCGSGGQERFPEEENLSYILKEKPLKALSAAASWPGWRQQTPCYVELFSQGPEVCSTQRGREAK